MLSSPLEFKLRPANINDLETIWKIIQHAILRRKEEGSTQWQDGYPNPETILNDINSRNGYVLVLDTEIVAYAAIIFDPEPAYHDIIGTWLCDQNYAVVHRVAVHEDWLGKGLATKIFELTEEVARKNEVYSIRVDTNFDNAPMLKILDKIGYSYCGEVFFRGSARKAFEKLL